MPETAPGARTSVCFSLRSKDFTRFCRAFAWSTSSAVVSTAWPRPTAKRTTANASADEVAITRAVAPQLFRLPVIAHHHFDLVLLATFVADVKRHGRRPLPGTCDA